MPIETLLLALTTFFATIGPADLLVVYAALTQKNTQAERLCGRRCMSRL